MNKKYPIVELNKVSRFIRGITFKPTDLVSKDNHDAVICLKTKNVQRELDQTDLIAIPETFVKRREQFLQEGDNLVSTANSFELVGKSCWIPKLEYKASAGGFVTILRPQKNKIQARYLYHWLQWGKTKLELMHCGRKTTNISNMDIKRAEKLLIPLPPLQEQKRIAEILDQADGIRQKRKQAIEKLNNLIPAIFYDMFGDPVTNPKGWEVKSIKNCVNFLTSGSRGWAKFYSEQGDKFLRIQNVKNNRLLLDDIAFVRAPITQEAKRTKVQSGDMLISITADLGRTAIIPDNIGNAYINQHLALVRLNNAVNSFYVSQYLSSEGGRIQFRKLNRIGVKAGLNFENILSLTFLCPPIDLQNRFSDTNKNIQKLITKHEVAFQKADLLFDSIVQKAFKGEL